MVNSACELFNPFLGPHWRKMSLQHDFLQFQRRFSSDWGAYSFFFVSCGSWPRPIASNVLISFFFFFFFFLFSAKRRKLDRWRDWWSLLSLRLGSTDLVHPIQRCGPFVDLACGCMACVAPWLRWRICGDVRCPFKALRWDV